MFGTPQKKRVQTQNRPMIMDLVLLFRMGDIKRHKMLILKVFNLFIKIFLFCFPVFGFGGRTRGGFVDLLRSRRLSGSAVTNI